MSPVIDKGEEIYAECISYSVAKPRRGDIVVFRTDEIPGLKRAQLSGKRLVGLPGDSLTIAQGVLCVNGQPAVFPNQTIAMPKLAPIGARYLADEWSAIRVPEGQYFVLGDNVTNSLDSRYFGCVPARAVVFHAIFRYFPASRIGWIH